MIELIKFQKGVQEFYRILQGNWKSPSKNAIGTRILNVLGLNPKASCHTITFHKFSEKAKHLL